jgi:hypothetical protein
MNSRFGRVTPADLEASQARRSVATFASYREAEHAVDLLAEQEFPVERTAIVGHGLKLVEQVTGRLGYLEAALRGAFAGAVVGVLIGWLYGVFNWFNPVVASAWLALDGLWFGALAGAAIGLLQRALMPRHREFASVGGLTAERFELLVDEDVADEAARLLGLGTRAQEMEGAAR